MLCRVESDWPGYSPHFKPEREIPTTTTACEPESGDHDLEYTAHVFPMLYNCINSFDWLERVVRRNADKPHQLPTPPPHTFVGP